MGPVQWHPVDRVVEFDTSTTMPQGASTLSNGPEEDRGWESGESAVSITDSRDDRTPRLRVTRRADDATPEAERAVSFLKTAHRVSSNNAPSTTNANRAENPPTTHARATSCRVSTCKHVGL
jgi:hypothetical protein